MTLKRSHPSILILFSIFSLFIHSNLNADNIEKTGDLLQIIIPVAAYSATFYLDDTEGREQFYRSFIATVGITQVLKNTVDKQRPNGASKAFPSGHTSAAFQGAAFIHQRYGLTYAIPAYVGATYVGYSRVETDHHDNTDVIAGAALGILSNLYFTKPFKGFMIAPSAHNGDFSITASTQF